MPHYVCCADLAGEGAPSETYTIDAIHGHFAYLKALPAVGAAREEAVILPVLLPEAAALERAKTAYARVAYQANLKNGGRLRVEKIQIIEILHYPYWVGYFQRRQGLSIRGIDAVNGDRTGPSFVKQVIDGLRRISDAPFAGGCPVPG